MNQLPSFAPCQSEKIPEPALPKSDADVLAWLRLARSKRVGPSTFIRLMREHGSAQAALLALPAIASGAGARGYNPCSLAQAEAEMEAGHKAGATLLCLGAANYPPYLALIADPPPLIWAIGQPSLAARPSVGLVGARNASSLGQRMAGLLASELAEAGYVICSGLARGVDTAAHKASLHGSTIAVLAGGVETIYPRENSSLWAQIAEQGLLLSEAPIGTSPQARHFPKRNRIISGISLGIVVVEGAAKSGSLITARNALDQGREVMAVPGSPLDPRASGCNMLLRDGAALIRSGADVVEHLQGPVQAALPLPSQAQAISRPEPSQPSPTAPPSNTIQGLLGPSPVPEDEIIRQSGIPAPQALEIIFDLELAGTLNRHPGGMISLAS